MAIAILSPHLDDAALSCWQLLTVPVDVQVINVFTGAPAASSEPAWWDRLTGATDSAERVRERIEEDREALAFAERTAVNLGFLDEQYRDAEQSLEPVVAGIRDQVAPGTVVYGPAALGSHADHALVRAATLELRRAGFVAALYADLPHAILYGWPSWVTGRDWGPDLTAALWEQSMVGTGIAFEAMAPIVHKLDPTMYERKLQAVRTYRTQVQALDELARRALADRETLGYEVVWELPLMEPQHQSPAGEGRLATPRPAASP